MDDCRNELDGSDDCSKIVLDSAFIFDLETAQILAQIFYLKHQWLVTDFVEKELKTPNLPMLKQMGLDVVALSGRQIQDVHVLARKYIEPSIQDLSCLVYARDNNVSLVTRDSALGRAARKEGVVVLDTQDVLIELVRAEVMSPHDAADALEVIQNERLRRPRSDWSALIKRWRRSPREGKE